MLTPKHLSIHSTCLKSRNTMVIGVLNAYFHCQLEMPLAYLDIKIPKDCCIILFLLHKWPSGLCCLYQIAPRTSLLIISFWEQDRRARSEAVPVPAVHGDYRWELCYRSMRSIHHSRPCSKCIPDWMLHRFYVPGTALYCLLTERAMFIRYRKSC